MFIKSSLIEQEVHKSMNFVHDLATLGVRYFPVKLCARDTSTDL